MTGRMTIRLCTWMTVAAALILATGPAAAHGLGVDGPSLGAGFAHPLGGLDHILAMVASGLWAAQRGGADLLRLPLTFVSAMAIGAGLALAGVMLPLVEFGIVGSVVLLGLFVALGRRLTGGAVYGLAALFALMHGHGHGSELPAAADPVLYGFGFLVATATLHAMGIGAGLVAKRFGPAAMASGLRAAGAFIALAGAGLLTQV